MSISTFASKLSCPMVLVAIWVSLVVAPTAVKADTYQIFNLGTDAAVSFYGMDDSGAVVLSFDETQACDGQVCYKTFLDGIAGSFALSAPTLAYDNGTSCTPILPSGATSQHAVCNNGREAFTGFLTTSQPHPGIYTGSDSALNFLTDIKDDSGEGPIFMDSLGDIVWDDHFSENFMEVVDLTTRTTPEPSSIALFGTGILAALGIMRRRQPKK